MAIEPEDVPWLRVWQQRVAELLGDMHAWATGAADGGPAGDGYYPIQNLSGQSPSSISPAALAARVPTGQPMMLTIACRSDDEAVRVDTRSGWRFAPRALTITSVGAAVSLPDQSAAGTDGIRIDLLVGGASILSAPLRILPGKRMSWAADTPQPGIVAPSVPARAEIVVAVLAEGVGALGLQIDIAGNYA